MADFHEDWFDDESCSVLETLLKRTEHLNGRVVEVGCWEGRSTIAIANAAWPVQIEAIDTWHGSPGEISSDLAQERDVLNQFLQNIASDTKGNVTVFQKDWRDHFFADHHDPIRFCHIDATHTYDEVRDNVAAVLALLEDGGIVCGDDAHHGPVRDAVLAVCGKSTNLSGRIWWYQKSNLGEKYDRACATPSDIYLHLPTFVALCESLDAKTVIELGTRGGVSTIAWLYGLERTDGHLYSVDIDPAPELTHRRWTFLQGNDLDPQIVKQLPDAEIVFIDTSHDYQQTFAELNVYRWKVKPGGRIVLHDTELAHPYGVATLPRYPVKTAVEEFCNEQGFTWTNHPECFGLGIITLEEMT